MFKKYKNKIIISSLVIVGIILIIISSIDCSSSNDKTISSTEYENVLEKKIESFLINVQGIKKAKVIVTLDTYSEKIYTQNTNSLNYIPINDGKSIATAEIFPTIRGIAVACTNGNNDNVRMQITELLSAYLGISSNRIKIVAIK